MGSPNAVDTSAVARTLLLVPGDKPGRFDKAATSGADGVILDLEDAVAALNKSAARSHVATWLTGGNQAVVRINAIDTPWFADDLAVLVGSGCTVMLPKASVDGVAAVVVRLGERTHVLVLLRRQPALWTPHGSVGLPT
jgi:citrate lyase subunit beta/citryl-CoA lyase